MNDQEFEMTLKRLMTQNFAAGSEAFREALLARCLTVLDEDDEVVVLDDSDLDLVAAAGDLTSSDPPHLDSPIL